MIDEIDLQIGPEESSSALGRVRLVAGIDNSLSIGVPGYGDATSIDGRGVVAILERWEGRLRLLVWSDIDEEEPTHIIDLEGARESARREAP